MFKLQYLRMRSRYMLFCFVAVFSFSILFIMFQNSLSRPAIETLVTETHKQINNFKNFKVILSLENFVWFLNSKTAIAFRTT